MSLLCCSFRFIRQIRSSVSGAAFEINEVTYNTVDEVWLLLLTATDKGAELAMGYIEFQKKRMAESNIVLMFGHLLADMGEYGKSQEYFERVLQKNPNDEEVACIYYNIGRIHRLKGEYEHALLYYERAYQRHITAKPPRLVSAAKTLNGIGVVYSEKKEHEQALQYLTKALKMYRKNLQKKHADIAGTLNNMGDIYYDKGLYDKALNYFKEANKMNERVLPRDHPSIGLTLNNIIYHT
ncbi:unnamed protein product [Didymodactylos carnosus]|uniref:Kinesin light chain n=1 Tax=Didymodactylos carnosus TaxID=1234261 RepID=A0A815HPQ4_9BILA|nr:unnamed protein product [Didymodactylos carnosus]CAF4233379.1 unnamed protein product [Didymodactylos carnosus]